MVSELHNSQATMEAKQWANTDDEAVTCDTLRRASTKLSEARKSWIDVKKLESYGNIEILSDLCKKSGCVIFR